jgi:hypothetical protein
VIPTAELWLPEPTRQRQVQRDAFAAPSAAAMRPRSQPRQYARCSHHQRRGGKPPNLRQRQAEQGRRHWASFDRVGVVDIQCCARLLDQLQQLRVQRCQICGARLGCGLRPLRCNQCHGGVPQAARQVANLSLELKNLITHQQLRA